MFSNLVPVDVRNERPWADCEHVSAGFERHLQPPPSMLKSSCTASRLTVNPPLSVGFGRRASPVADCRPPSFAAAYNSPPSSERREKL
jgi:hypothetical protein